MFFENKLLDYVHDNNGKNILLTKIHIYNYCSLAYIRSK